jgi:hypothetical protein
VSAVASMACVYCSRLQGREHVEGCPVELGAGNGGGPSWTGALPAAYANGWEAARAVTVDALAGQRAGLDHALGVAEDNFNGDAQGALMLRAVRALCEAEGLLP